MLVNDCYVYEASIYYRFKHNITYSWFIYIMDPYQISHYMALHTRESQPYGANWINFYLEANPLL